MRHRASARTFPQISPYQSLVAALALVILLGGRAPSSGAESPAEHPTSPRFDSAAASRAEFDRAVAPVFAKYCVSCHGPDKKEGDLLLSDLDPDMRASSSAGRWALLLEQLATRVMPPKDSPQPSDEQMRGLVQWIGGEMKRAGKYAAKRQAYANGNQVAHSLLFDPTQAMPFDAAPRIRPLSPEIYAGLLGDLTKKDGLGQPFSPAGKSTFKDLGESKFGEPVTSQLLANALTIAEQQTAYKFEGDELKGVSGTPKEFLALLDSRHPPTDSQIEAAITRQFDTVLRRRPTADELARFVAFAKQNLQTAGPVPGTRYTLAAVLLLPEAVMRLEVGDGVPDDKGRLRLAPRTIAYSLAYALTDKRPDAELLRTAESGGLDTDDKVAAYVTRMLANSKLDKPRILRFFREYFGYDAAKEVFKNQKDNPDHDPKALVEDTDRLVQYILEQDQNVLREMLTTNKSFVAYKTAADAKQKRAAALAKFEAEKQANPEKFKNKEPPRVGRSVYEAYNLTDFPDTQPVELPANERAGILTQPAWLVAFSTSDDNHAIHRGKWIRERLLGGVVPDIPITVDAQLPIAPEKTLRERMEVTHQEYCWKCHRLMNNTGLTFEIYDHFGRFRNSERVLDVAATAKNVDKKGQPAGPVYHGLPIDAQGLLELTGDERVEGKSENAIELMHHLAKSELVEQVFVRHAFRYWMGRNESLGDAKTLQNAQRAYRESGGSMKALIVSLLSSESFLYRVPAAEARAAERALMGEKP